MDLAKIKRFYIETWWLWSLYFVLGILAVIYVHWVFITAFPIVGAISVYFAVIRGPSQPLPADKPPEK